jgi:hypothetical protein
MERKLDERAVSLSARTRGSNISRSLAMRSMTAVDLSIVVSHTDCNSSSAFWARWTLARISTRH